MAATEVNVFACPLQPPTRLFYNTLRHAVRSVSRRPPFAMALPSLAGINDATKFYVSPAERPLDLLAVLCRADAAITTVAERRVTVCDFQFTNLSTS